MKKIIFIVSLFCITLMGIAQVSSSDFVQQDTVIINGGWRCRYLESPVYIKNKDYVVFQYLNTRKILYPDMETFRILQNYRDCPLGIDKNGVYYQGLFVKADTTDVKLVGEKYTEKGYQYLWKNKEKVFRDTVELIGIDAESFAPIECYNGQYFKDKNYVYYFDKKIEGSDGATVNKTCSDVCYDKNHIYIKGEIATYEGEKLESINSILAKTDRLVIDRSTMQPVEGIDAATIVKLSDRYAMDKNHVYFGVVKMPIEKANLKNVKVWEQVNSLYVTDGINIYVVGGGSQSPQINLDAKTFGMLPHSDLVYDRNGIYQRKTINKNNKFVLDKYPFNYTKPVSDKNTFLTDNNLYIIYENQAYDMRTKKLYTNLSFQEIQLVKEGALLPITNDKSDLESPKLRSIGYSYSKKGNSIYLDGKELSGIEDIDSFRPFNYTYAKDKHSVYYLNDRYSVSKGHRYSMKPIKGADPNTFEFNVLTFDKDSVYIGGKPLMSSENIEFLAIYSGYRPGCGMDRTPSSNYIFMRNKDGFWLVETTYYLYNIFNIKFLGKVFNPRWNKVFEDFELVS